MRAVAAVVLLAVACAPAVAAHGGGRHAGFVATVSGIEPPLPGLLVTVLDGHERLSIRNWTQRTIVVFGEDGREALRLAPGEARTVADPRIGSSGPPPAEGEFVKNWRIRGEADGTPFDIVGFLGYRPPRDAVEEDDSGLPTWAVALVVGAGVLAAAAALALPLRRRGGREVAADRAYRLGVSVGQTVAPVLMQLIRPSGKPRTTGLSGEFAAT
jgi:hypothetical protein